MLYKALRLIRSFHDMSQTELSESLGISKSYLSEIESGKKQPTLDILEKYSKEFEIPLSSIMFFSETIDANKLGEKVRVSLAKKVVSILEWNQSRNERAEAKKKAQTV
ncbi:helix-turn-helix domain-containing protein [Pseudomonas mosselii]|uniref:helix-turn-helix transcriptional regulator n=1 Tax=Pseudomonas mosselii TaxID=78327 RepID=UPI00244D6657|nr:helix-turn-helix transcriptional regulator [Pseudomonas mosselii]MDH1511881.1 helix-turn-helix domain-containing protein [Pseudomonas mosselii]